MSKYKCINCDCSIDNFDDVWDHVNGFSHVMQVNSPKHVQQYITSESSSIYIVDEYLFMANCTEADFYNFLLRKWSEK